jgi:hypothetical protein
MKYINGTYNIMDIVIDETIINNDIDKLFDDNMEVD